MQTRWDLFIIMTVIILVNRTGHAQDEIIKPFKFGGQYHFNFFYSDDGLNDVEDASRTAQQRFGIRARTAKLVFTSGLAENLDLTVRFNMLNNELEYAYLNYRVKQDLSLTVGRTKERIFGWHRRLTGSLTPIVAAYLSEKPMSYPDGMQVSYQLGQNKFLVQIVKDFFDCNTSPCDSWNKLDANGVELQKQPAILSEWIGSSGNFQPLVQYASYDLGKSFSWSAGLRFKNERFDVHADYTTDNRVKRGSNGTNSFEEKTVLTGYVLHGEWKTGKFTPYFHISNFDQDQFTPAGTTAIKVNREYTKFDDNNITWGIGSHYNLVNEAFRPYFLISSKSGDFLDPQDAAGSKTLTEMQVLLGVTGEL